MHRKQGDANIYKKMTNRSIRIYTQCAYPKYKQITNSQPALHNIINFGYTAKDSLACKLRIKEITSTDLYNGLKTLILHLLSYYSGSDVSFKYQTQCIQFFI